MTAVEGVAAIVVMGVSGAGKSTVGRLIAARLDCPFRDADSFHPAANIEKMRRGEPLTDDDRRPWLETLRQRLDQSADRGEDVVLACSALKHEYRDYLREDVSAPVRYVYLEGSEELIRERLAKRKGHFMPPGLLHSQFEALEPPKDALRVDIAPPVEEIAETIRRKLALA